VCKVPLVGIECQSWIIIAPFSGLFFAALDFVLETQMANDTGSFLN
jgi:hypothetical protein